MIRPLLLAAAALVAAASPAGAGCTMGFSYFLHDFCLTGCGTAPCPREANLTPGGACSQRALPLANGDICQPIGGTACWVLHQSAFASCRVLPSSGVLMELSFSNTGGSAETVTVVLGSAGAGCVAAGGLWGTATVPGSTACTRICLALTSGPPSVLLPAGANLAMTISATGTTVSLCYDGPFVAASCSQAACDSHLCFSSPPCSFTTTPTVTHTSTQTPTRTETPTFACPPLPVRNFHDVSAGLLSCGPGVMLLSSAAPTASLVQISCAPTPGGSCEWVFADPSASNVVIAPGTYRIDLAISSTAANSWMSVEIGKLNKNSCGFSIFAVGGANYGLGTCVPWSAYLTGNTPMQINCDEVLAVRLVAQGSGSSGAALCLGSPGGPSLGILCIAITPSPSCTPTVTVTPTITQTSTRTDSPTASGTSTASPSPTVSRTASGTATRSRTFSLTPTATATTTRIFTGTPTETPTATIETGEITVYPNPVRGHATFAYLAPGSGILRVRIWTFSGLAAAEKESAIDRDGLVRVVVDASKIAPGVYFYQGTFVARGGETRKTSIRKLVVER